jgi:Do/DeqQ family serine protease
MTPTRARLAIALAVVSALATRSLSAAAQAPKDAVAANPMLQASQAEARRMSDAFVSVAERVSPSVVQIDVTVRDERRDEFQRWFGGGGDSPIERGTGSGVIFTSDGAIVTNNHVIEGALTINVHLRDGRFLPARLVGRDPATDVAVIKIDAAGLVAAHFADSEQARVGEWVVAIGSPFGLGYSVTTGVLSAKGRGGLGMNQVADYLQTDASINPGNSGGPLCTLDGHVVGINAMIKQGAGIGFAVPSNLVRRVAEQLLRSGKVQRPWLAASLQDLTPDLAVVMKLDARAGALVDSVVPDGPAARAQIQPGDVLASIAGKPVHDSRELIQESLMHEVGQTVQVEVIRGGHHYGTNLTFTARPEPAVPEIPAQEQTTQSGLGLAVRALSAAQASQLGFPAHELGMVSTAVPGSAADRAGLHAGDVIVEADGIPYPTTKQLEEAAADGQLLLRLHRRDQDFYAALRK